MGGSLVGVLGLVEGLKSYSLNHFNIQEKHGIYTAVMLGDAGFRLLLLQLLLPFSGGDPALLLIIPIAGAAVVTLLTTRNLAKIFSTENSLTLASLIKTHGTFLAPVVLFAVTTWVTGLSDRYFLLRWAGGGETGKYAAVYGIFGTPFTLLSATLIQVFRPRLSSLLAEPGGQKTYRVTYRHFFLIGSISVFLLAIFLWAVSGPLCLVMLRPEHRPLLVFLPFLLLGQVALAIGQLVEQEFYIHQKISLIVIKQMAGLICALIFMSILIPRFGVLGAMTACACYYCLEFCCGLALFVWNRNNLKGLTDEIH